MVSMAQDGSNHLYFAIKNANLVFHKRVDCNLLILVTLPIRAIYVQEIFSFFFFFKKKLSLATKIKIILHFSFHTSLMQCKLFKVLSYPSIYLYLFPFKYHPPPPGTLQKLNDSHKKYKP